MPAAYAVENFGLAHVWRARVGAGQGKVQGESMSAGHASFLGMSARIRTRSFELACMLNLRMFDVSQ